MCFVRRYASAVKKVETHIIQQAASRLLSKQIVSGAAVCLKRVLGPPEWAIGLRTKLHR